MRILVESQNNEAGIQSEDILDEQIKDFIVKLEEEELHVIKVANEAEMLYQNRHLEVLSCECAIHTCSNNIEDLECHHKLRAYNYCNDSAKEFMDPDRYGIRVPPGADPNYLSDDLKISICTFQLILLMHFSLLLN